MMQLKIDLTESLSTMIVTHIFTAYTVQCAE